MQVIEWPSASTDRRLVTANPCTKGPLQNPKDDKPLKPHHTMEARLRTDEKLHALAF